jgi:HK97 family phage prohead protease
MTDVDLDQRAQLAALMAPRRERGLDPSELAPASTDNLIRKTLLTGDKPEARSLTGEAGTVEAVVSTWETDRQGEAFAPGAFADTIQRWRQSGKQLPVLYAYDAANPSMLVGAIDPSQMFETSEGLHVKGRLDLQSRRGSEVYDLLKRGAPLGWSVGALILRVNTVNQHSDHAGAPLWPAPRGHGWPLPFCGAGATRPFSDATRGRAWPAHAPTYGTPPPHRFLGGRQDVPPQIPQRPTQTVRAQG